MEAADAPDDWADLDPAALLTPSGALNGLPLYALAEIPDAALPAEQLIERLAAVPGGSPLGRERSLREALLERGETDDERAVAAIIADAARKLGVLSWAIDEALSEWQLSRWALTERIHQLDREKILCEEKLERLPDPEAEAPRLQQAAIVAQEEMAGLIAFLDSFRLQKRRERASEQTESAPAFARTENTLRLLKRQESPRKPGAPKKKAA